MPESAANSGRSAMGRASDALPFKPYVYRGGDREPAAVTRARERHQALNAAIAETAAPGPDDAGYEWRREQLLEGGGEWPAAAPALAAAPEPVSCQRCGELEDEIATLKAEVGTLTEQLARVAAVQEPPAPPVRCKRCGYLTMTSGHRVMCGG